PPSPTGWTPTTTSPRALPRCSSASPRCTKACCATPRALPPMPSRTFCRPDGAQATLNWHAPGLMAGVDEAGRGPLAGPVVAAAAILDGARPIAGLADSKALTAARRERLYDEICAHALCVSVAQASVHEIDELNILQATMLAMARAVQGL